MKAVIMAGGEGSRLRPLTCDLPKPMVPVMNIPIMEHIIELLKSHNITEIGVTLMYLPQKIRDYFGDGTSFGVRLSYFTEDTPLGTAGSVKNTGDFLDGTFLVISGDSLTNLNITEALKYHNSKKSMATLVLSRVDVPLEYGVVITDNDGSIRGFLEKPSWGEVFSDTVNTGTYILEPEVMEFHAKGAKYDFSQDLFPLLLSKNIPMYGYVMSGYWCDIGDLGAYIRAHSDILEGKIRVKTNAREIKKGIWAGSGTQIDPSAQIASPCFIGRNCHIGSNVSIGKYSVLGDNNIIEENVSLKRTIIWDSSYIESGCELRASIICRKVRLKHHVSVFEGSVIGDHSTINERALVKPNVKIWPQKVVEPFAIVDRNVIWGAKYSKAIFGESGISGIINVDISPEFATRLGAAYGSMFKRGSRVVVSSTTSNSARMFKHAFISGILSVGVDVFNMSSLLTPISRHAINFLSVEGGIHIKLSDDNPNKLRVDFMDSKGAAVSRVMERKIENAFYREDFKRSLGEDISRLNNITDYRNYYIRSILNEIDADKVKEKSPKIDILSPSDFVISTIVSMLSDMGCNIVSFSSGKPELSGRVYEYIRKTDADFAAYIDSNGESLVLIDKTGRVISDDLFMCLASLIVFKSMPGAKVAVPVTAPSAIDSLAEKYKAKVVKTKTSTQAVMEEMLNLGLLKNGSSKNTLQFLLNFDALAGLGKVIEFLCSYNTSLTELLDEIPVFHVSRMETFCPWELKGSVMRTLITERGSEKLELIDGVKFTFDRGWALVVPDSEMPVFRVYSEGTSPGAAKEICGIYIDKIKNILKRSSQQEYIKFLSRV